MSPRIIRNEMMYFLTRVEYLSSFNNKPVVCKSRIIRKEKTNKYVTEKK